MYPYHNRIKQRIKNGELIGIEFAENYTDIGECLVLKFKTEPFLRPVRSHKYNEYLPIINWWLNENFNIKENCEK